MHVFAPGGTQKEKRPRIVQEGAETPRTSPEPVAPPRRSWGQGGPFLAGWGHGSPSATEANQKKGVHLPDTGTHQRLVLWCYLLVYMCG